MTLDNIIENLSALIFIKFGILIVLGLFIIFLIIVFNQISTLSRVIEQDGSGRSLKVINFLIIVLSLSLFLTALVIL